METNAGNNNSIWTPANVVTCIRIVFIPVFMLMLWISYALPAFLNLSGLLAGWSFFVYVLLSLTDKVDGHLARSRNEITDFGKFLDPIADKLLVFSALLLLQDLGYVSLWVVFIILVREFLVSALRMVASANGVVVAADELGKAKTAVTMVAICGYLLLYALAANDMLLTIQPLISNVSWILMALAVILTVVSGIQYFWSCRNGIFTR